MSGARAPFRERPLPASLPIFPLVGVLLLPRGQLPLNIFEPRYLDMIDDALAGDRMIGMIQPAEPGPMEGDPPVFPTGCAGRITGFAEDGERYLITLTGVSRFDIAEELPRTTRYRRVVADWAPYRADRAETPELGLERKRLIAGLHGYFKRHGLSADWSAIEAAPDERLVTLLSMICPFAPLEKQALLTASDGAARARLLVGLVEASAFEPPGAAVRH